MNLDKLIEQLFRGEMLSENTIKNLCEKMKEHLLDEANVTNLRLPMTIVGDIHGHFRDLLEIFHIGGKCPDTNYLFLGNYVDRGSFSAETISLLFCLKLRHPTRITLLRGNHESKPITQVYGFYGECLAKYGNPNPWKYFTDVFNYLPLAAVIEEKIFCVHGGLSSTLTSLEQIKVLPRFQDVPPEGSITDLLWSDPDPEKEGYTASPRGPGCLFGQDVVNRFLKFNRLEYMVRSNQLCIDGYQMLFGGKFATVWSAPNFCNRSGNVGAILEISEDNEKYFNTFTACPEALREKPTFDVLKDVPDYYATL
eukprot:TRINITY_DN10786_c0_g1_i1.p1 TRINITY_DN10786_c0_g1~~TRINITY_DN10786_c0_g1_i1.p1  ORF type:complete len:310 (+),score=46.32 TRINITY_DN10786_c0_g1_i1:2-931(+)